ncbi:MAG TPA: hypothetical protein VJA25_09010 [Dehalococcoidia bacterium]|nr:hypothetical protein [Dehalococcoidia bacterium]
MAKPRRMFRCSDGRERPEGALRGRWLREWNAARHAMNKVNQLRVALDFVCFADPERCHYPIEAHRYSRIRSGMQTDLSCPRCGQPYQLRHGRWYIEGAPNVDLHADMPAAPLPPKSAHTQELPNPSKAADNIHLGHVYDYCQHCGKELPGGHHARQRFCNDAHRQAHGRQVRRAKFA